jgi:LuxR family transcriptional regulator of csgAB operon
MDKTARCKPPLFAVPSQRLMIVGRTGLHNSLLGQALERQVGARCTVTSPDALKSFQVIAGTIALVDAGAAPNGALDVVIDSLCRETSLRAVAIFNADADMRIERFLQRAKLKGVFHRDASEDHLVKGLRAIIDGETWLPRKMLNDYLELTRTLHRLPVGEVVELTRKERETLGAMVGGASNLEIASSLNVSPHTVKTHVYNLFRKIKVSNRVQAVSWALQNLEPGLRGVP